MGYATPKAFYEALKEAGGTPGENMTMDNKETTHVAGSKLDISVNWQGAAKAYAFDEVIVDSNGKKLDAAGGFSVCSPMADILSSSVPELSLIHI